jgi:hypothetical protein
MSLNELDSWTLDHECDNDKIRKCRTDYNNNPPNDISLILTITSTSGRLHSDFVCLLFLQTHRETESLFVDSGVQLVEHDREQFHYHHVVFSSQPKSKCGNILTKVTTI